MKVINARSTARAQFQAIHGAQVRMASDAAVVAVELAEATTALNEQIDAAISGDLIAASPALAEKIGSIERRIDALEP